MKSLLRDNNKVYNQRLNKRKSASTVAEDNTKITTAQSNKIKAKSQMLLNVILDELKDFKPLILNDNDYWNGLSEDSRKDTNDESLDLRLGTTSCSEDSDIEPDFPSQSFYDSSEDEIIRRPKRRNASTNLTELTGIYD